MDTTVATDGLSTEPVEGTPAGEGVVEPGLGGESVDATPSDSTDTPDVPRLSLDEFGDHLVPIKVDGEERWVPFKEAHGGFMRHADYTRKTQEIAQLRQRLAHAEAIANSLESDPEGTLRALAEVFSVPLEARAADDWSDGEDPGEPDPVEARLRAIEEREHQRQAAAVRAQIDQEIDTLISTYGDFDLEKVMQHAVQNGVTLTTAYRDLHFDEIAAKQRAEEAAIAAKRDAAIVEGGAHRANVVEKPQRPGSIREAYRMALKSVGG